MFIIKLQIICGKLLVPSCGDLLPTVANHYKTCGKLSCGASLMWQIVMLPLEILHSSNAIKYNDSK